MLSYIDKYILSKQTIATVIYKAQTNGFYAEYTYIAHLLCVISSFCFRIKKLI